MYNLFVTAEINDVDPADLLARIADHPAKELDPLQPWVRQSPERRVAA